MSIQITDSTSAVVVSYSTNKAIKQIEVFSFPATADATQGDYVSFSNTAGQTYAAWLDIDADGTEPTGLFFGNSVVQIKVPIVTGGTAAENAAAFVLACEADLDWALITLTDIEDGTVELRQSVAASCGIALAFSADDADSGSIVATTTLNGLSTSIVRQDSYTKGSFSIVADITNNLLVFNTNAANGVGAKGKESTPFKYAEITVPSSTGLLDLKAQLDVFNVVTGGSTGSTAVVGEDAKLAEFTGTNDTFTTTFPFVYQTEEVFYNQVKMTRGVDYNALPPTGTIVFTFDPDPTINDPAVTPLTFNYIKA